MKKMLLICAHPDDETISCGGTIAKYARAGWHVQLICATDGEAGSLGQYTDISGQQLGDIRRKELEKAGELLGISMITFLGYKDGALKNQTAGELEDVVYRKMTEFAPDVVITYESNGISNHPDHMKLTLASTYAFQKYAKGLLDLPNITTLKGTKVRELTRAFQKSFAESLEKQGDPKLYYACLPESVVVYLQKMHALPQESFGRPWAGVKDKFVTTVIDIKRYGSAKIQALQKHLTQKEDFAAEMAIDNNPQFLKEFFILRMQGVYEIFMGNNDRVSDRL